MSAPSLDLIRDYIVRYGGRIELRDPPYMTLVGELIDDALRLYYVTDDGDVDYGLIFAGSVIFQQLWTGNVMPVSYDMIREKVDDIYFTHFSRREG